MVKIESKTQVNSRLNGLCFLSREIIKFDFNLKTDTFQPYIKETLFKKENDSIIVIKEEVVPAALFTKENVDSLFTLLNDPIIVSESFTDQFKELLKKALLADTQSFEIPLYGIDANDWEITI